MQRFRGLRGALAAVAVVGLAGSATALGSPARHPVKLSPERAARDAKLVDQHVVVVLRSQHGGRLASASSVRARQRRQALDRRPLLAQIASAGGSVTRQFTVLNGFAATVSSAERARLAADPTVAKVLPDAVVTLPQGDPAAPAASPNPGNPSTPLSTICPTDPTKPLLEPEALQTMHVAYTDPTIPQAQSIATGQGVRVAFFADGLDIDNPDFIRADGSHVFIDYRDFTGDGPNAPTGAAEAFGDASSIAAQGRRLYDLSTVVNPAHPLPPGCTITVRGVAPGASLIGMKVFGTTGSAFSSMIVQGMDWAVTHDHADILSESFGGYPIPDTAADIIRQFNDQAVAAGITVSQGAGDAGAEASPTPPATDPLVIDATASTNFRAYAQASAYGFQFSNGTYLSDNISSIGGAGFSQDGQGVDLVAPGEADWALCTPNAALYTECTDFKGAPSPLQQFGGTSQATPLTAGAAALVIQAYRDAHGGRTPAPALVKRILTSTANDLGAPSVEQGSGEVDALKAVQAARSVDQGTPTGHSLVIGPSQVHVTAPAGSPGDATVAVTNTGAGAQTVSAHARALVTQVSDQKVDVTLGASPTFVDHFGSPRPYTLTTFSVPAGVDRLIEDDAWAGPGARVGVALIDPNGSYAAYTRPQGNGNHGQVDVRQPVAGTWTAVVFLRDGTFTGTVHLELATQRFGTVDSVTPASQTLAPGATGRFHLHTTLPADPGDVAHDLVVSDSSGDQTVVPVVLRSLVDVGRHGGEFSGTLVGGNGRIGGTAQQQTYAFDVPRGRPELSAAITFPDDAGTEVQGYLIDPGGNALGAASTRYVDAAGKAHFTNALQAYRLDPEPGRWKLVVNVPNPVGGTTLTAPLHGTIGFDPPRVIAHGLPSGERLRAGQPVTATLTVRNDGPAIEDVFADPRLKGEQTLFDGFALTQPSGVPLPTPGNPPFFLVPTQTSGVLGVAEATAPIVLELGYGVFGEGDPDVGGFSQGNSAAAFYGANEVAPGPWFVAPSLRGPFDGPASGKADTALLVRTRGFDTDASSSTGDVWRQTVDPTAPSYTPLTLQPGQSGTITVTFTPHGRRGSAVRGILYVDDFSRALTYGNEQVAIPYRYRVR